MARYARKTTRRRAPSGGSRYGRRPVGRSRIRARAPRRTSSGRAQTIRIVVQGTAPAGPSLTMSEAGRLLTPSGSARSKF